MFTRGSECLLFLSVMPYTFGLTNSCPVGFADRLSLLQFGFRAFGAEDCYVFVNPKPESRPGSGDKARLARVESSEWCLRGGRKKSQQCPHFVSRQLYYDVRKPCSLSKD